MNLVNQVYFVLCFYFQIKSKELIGLAADLVKEFTSALSNLHTYTEQVKFYNIYVCFPGCVNKENSVVIVVYFIVSEDKDLLCGISTAAAECTNAKGKETQKTFSWV